MGSSSQTPVTQQTTQTKDPWSAAQPYLQSGMNSANTLYNANIGYQPWTGSTVADLNPTLSQGLGAQSNLATASLGGTPGVVGGINLGTDLIRNSGMNPALNKVAGQYQSLYDEAAGQQNPYLQQILDTQNRQIGDRVNAAMAGAGRYGSGAHTDVMTRALAEAEAPVLAQDYAQRQQQRMQATGQLGNLYGEGLTRAGQWSQLMPTLDQARYQPAQNLAAIGQYYQDRAQQQLQGQINTYNAQQAWPWEQLARANAIYGQAGGLGGTQVTTSPGATQPSTLQRVLGGATAGAGIGTMFGPGIGTGVGAAAGGLLGLLR